MKGGSGPLRVLQSNPRYFTGNGIREMRAPFKGDAVLYVRRA